MEASVVVAIDGHEEIAGIGIVIIRNMLESHNLSVRNSDNNIIGVGVDDSIHHHLAQQRHLAVEKLRGDIFPRTDCTHLDHDLQRFGKTVFIGKVDDFRVNTHSQILVDGEDEILCLLRIDAAVCLIHIQPVGQAVNGVLMAATADIRDLHGNFRIAVCPLIENLIDSIAIPQQDVLVDKDLPHRRVDGAIAVEVLHIAHRDIDIVLVDLAVLHVEIDKQFVVIETPVEVHLRQHVTFAYRRVVTRVAHSNQCQRVGGDNQRLHLFHHCSIAEREDALVVDGENLFHNAVETLFLFRERQQGHKTHFVAHWRKVVVGFYKAAGQCLLEEHKVVEMTLEKCRLSVLIATQHHDATQTGEALCSKGIDHLAVNIDGGIVVGAVDGKDEMVPKAVGITKGALLLHVPIVQHEASVHHFHQCTLRAGARNCTVCPSR